MRRYPKRDINKLVQILKSIEGVEAAIVYGSIARGDYGPRSDIDVLIIVNTSDTADIAQDILAGLQLNRTVQPLIRTQAQLEESDSGLMKNIFMEGEVLFARKPLSVPVAAILNLRPWVLYTFKLTDLPQKEKARFNRQLYNSSNQGRAGGALGDAGGRKLARGCVMVPAVARKQIDTLFRRFKVQAESSEIWV
ncbi:nucleotidyltransferase domain-containing protein [Gemmatimonadota bacterium]